MPSRSIIYALCALVVLLALPLALKLVGPNPWYGFRTAATLANPSVWYRANLVAGILLLIWMPVASAVVFSLPDSFVAAHSWTPVAILFTGLAAAVTGALCYVNGIN